MVLLGWPKSAWKNSGKLYHYTTIQKAYIHKQLLTMSNYDVIMMVFDENGPCSLSTQYAQNHAVH